MADLAIRINVHNEHVPLGILLDAQGANRARADVNVPGLIDQGDFAAVYGKGASNRCVKHPPSSVVREGFLRAPTGAGEKACAAENRCGDEGRIKNSHYPDPRKTISRWPITC